MGLAMLRKREMVLDPEMALLLGLKLMLAKEPGVVTWNDVVQLM